MGLGGWFCYVGYLLHHFFTVRTLELVRSEKFGGGAGEGITLMQ
jgi:hypothetical protein